MKTKIFFLLFLSFSLTLIGFLYKNNSEELIQNTPLEAKPFEELTIPYLRSLNYKSSLEDMELVSETESYSGFLTSYKSEGNRINAYLTIPKGEKPESGWPAIIFIHGYIPPSQYSTLERYADYVDYLARNGFVVFKIDLRGHGDSEGQAEGAYYASGYIIDTLNARASLQASDFVDPKKIGLWGHSMAGNVVLRSMAVKPEIAAAVIWAGAVYSYSDFAKYRLNDQSYRPPDASRTNQGRRQEIFDRYGQFDPKSDFWKKVAATNFLNDLKGAIQIHHAQNDNVVNIGYSRDLVKLLDETRIPYELYEYDGGGHNIESPYFEQAMQRSVDFFNNYF